jgi:type IV secretion system protein VirD4
MGIFVLLLLLIGGGAWWFFSRKPTYEPVPVERIEDVNNSVRSANAFSANINNIPKINRGVVIGVEPFNFELHGENMKNYVPTPQAYFGDRHIITFGPVGSGKGVTAQIPALLDTVSPFSALVIDVKGQLCAVTGQARFLAGQEVYAINPFDTLKIPTATYNPLRFLDPASLSFASDCKRIAEGLGFEGVENSGDKNAFFEMTALDLVNVLIQWAVKYAGKEKWEEYDPTLVTVRKILNLEPQEQSDFFTALSGLDDPAIAEGARLFVKPEKDKELRGAIQDCIATARGKLAFLRDAGIERILRGGENEISFADLKRKLVTVYLIIPPELLSTHGRFLRLMVMSALNELFKERATPINPVLLMLDEFAQLGYMSLIENVASVGRDYKIRLWCILQNIPQLKALYKDRWESFLSSAGVAQFFTPNDNETATYISRRSGTRTVQRKSTGTTSGSSAGGASNSTSESYSEAYEPRLKLDDIYRLPKEHQIVFVPNVAEEIILHRQPYYESPHYKNTSGLVLDPYHMDAETLREFTAWMRDKDGCFVDPPFGEYLREEVARYNYIEKNSPNGISDEEFSKLFKVGCLPSGLYCTTEGFGAEELQAALPEIKKFRLEKGYPLFNTPGLS